MPAKCIKCGFSEHESEAEFCSNCGMALDSNFCTNPDCFVRNNGDRLPCKETACYCDHCGAETEYFRAGLIKPIDCSK